MRDGWRTVTLGQIAGTVRETVKASSVELPYIGLEHFDPGSPHLSRHGASRDMESAATRISRGDVLFSKLRPYLNKVAVSPFDATCTTELLAWRRRDGAELRQDFLALLLRDEAAVAYANHSAGGTRMPRTSAKVMAAYPVLLPPLDEQQRIVDLIAAVDDAIEAAEAEASLGDDVAQILLRGLRSLPQRKISDFARFVYGQSLTKDSRDPGDVPVFGSAGEIGRHIEPNTGHGPVVVVGRKGVDARGRFATAFRDLPPTTRGWGGAGSVRYSNRPVWVIDTAFSVVPASVDFAPVAMYWSLAAANLPRVATTTTLPGLSATVAGEVLAADPACIPKVTLEVFDAIEGSVLVAIAHADALRSLRSNLLTALLSGEHEIPSSYDRFLEEAA